MPKGSTIGAATAQVGVLVYSDFECPYCARFARDTMPTLVRDYVDRGRVALAFKHLPLEAIHPRARKAAEAAECAGEQGRFWQMHDLLFALPRALQPSDLNSKAARLGIDRLSFSRCLDGEMAVRVDNDLEEARELMVSGTPTFFFGALQRDGTIRVIRRESGAIPPKAFSKILDEVLGSKTNIKD